MNTKRIRVPGTNDYYTISVIEDFEFANPIEKISEIVIGTTIEFGKNRLKADGNVQLSKVQKINLFKEAVNDWKDFYNEIMSSKPHENFFYILTCKSKKEQVKALKGLSLTDNEFFSIIIRSWLEYGFTYSSYSATHYPTGRNRTELPELVHKTDDSKIISIGETSLNEGQLRQTLEHRKVMNMKFLDKGDTWHCFFQTLNSLVGKEAHKDGQPHLHYISNYWNLSRDEVKKRLLSKEGLTSSVHIDYYGHRNPKI